MSELTIPVQMLGQVGCRLAFSGATIYFDPYLSNSVQELEAPDAERLIPVPFPPDSVTDADWVLITHAHMDHCDPHTIPKLAQASPQACFIGPAPVLTRLKEWGIQAERLKLAAESWIELGAALRVRAVPAAHSEVERDHDGNLACVGFVLEYEGRRIYFAGDTSARQEVIDALVEHGPLHTAFLPVNEHNFFRGRRGIVGNMSVREAFQLAIEIGVSQVVAVHWDMFAANDVDPDEIRLIHKRMNAGFALLLRPESINLTNAQISIVIRTLNEAVHLEELLKCIASQRTAGLSYEVVLVDSGSTDGTLEIAERYGCRILHIKRHEFSFGRSLNMGCEAATGSILVFTSGHCVPVDENWLQRLCQPILDNKASYVYGRQHGGNNSHFSETRIFAKYYPEQSRLPQEDFFCNNANAALSRDSWIRHRFDEDLTGLEDMALAQRLIAEGERVAYVADAEVYHYHNESWAQIQRRFERESIALRQIMPQVHVSLWDTIRYIATSIWKDWNSAARAGVLRRAAMEIVFYRWNQYWGSYRGNHEHRKLSHYEKEKYFFPQ